MIKITTANVFDGCTALTKIYTFSSNDTKRYRADPVWALLGTKVNHI